MRFGDLGPGDAVPDADALRPRRAWTSKAQMTTS
jgi:hypothetical protein